MKWGKNTKRCIHKGKHYHREEWTSIGQRPRVVAQMILPTVSNLYRVYMSIHCKGKSYYYCTFSRFLVKELSCVDGFMSQVCRVTNHLDIHTWACVELVLEDSATAWTSLTLPGHPAFIYINEMIQLHTAELLSTTAVVGTVHGGGITVDGTHSL